MSASRMVQCAKLGREAPGLEAPPFAGELGQKIYDNVSQQAWAMWRDDMMIKVINEYRLDLSDAAQYETLLKQMEAFLGLDKKTAVVEVENAERGRAEKP